MTNEEKFKTADERREEYKKYCKYNVSQNLPMFDILEWLEFEYVEELKPCPFCGSEALLISGLEDNYVICRNDDCAAAIVARSFSSPEEAITAWNRRAK